MQYLKAFGDVLRHLIPIRYPGEAEESYRWRCWAAALQSILWCVVVAHMLWAAGWLIKLGLDGPPTPSDINAINNTMAELRQRLDDGEARDKYNQQKLLDQALREYRVRQCRAISERNLEAMTFADEKMAQLQDEYYELNKRPYNMQSCNAIMPIP